MYNPTDCDNNLDSLKLIRDGANQEQRLSPALDPSYVLIDEHGTAHGMMFAQAVSEFIKYFDSSNIENGNWTAFFSNDPSFRLAVTSVQNIEDYKTQIKAYFDFLNNLDNESKGPELIDNLSYIYSCLVTLAKQLDELKEGLSDDISLKSTLKNLIQSQLAPAFQRLIAYQKAGAGIDLGVVKNVAPPDSMKILGVLPDTFDKVLTSGFSKEWITSNATKWMTYIASIAPDASVYGNTLVAPPNVTFKRTNHIATHNLFTSVSDQFLKVFARVISEARLALEFTFTNWDRHDPHYVLFLSFLRLMETARTEANTITGRHLDFYYREMLKMKEKPALPAQVHLIVELAKQAEPYQIKKGELFRAGKDDKGNEAFFSNNRDMVANHAKVTSLRTVYRHGIEPVNGLIQDADIHNGRLYASPSADSNDGIGAKLTSPDLSWHPFYNKTYQDGALKSINMPKAEAGFAIVSHYLLLAEGNRTITLDFTITGFKGNTNEERATDVICLFSGEKGWIEKTPVTFTFLSNRILQLKVELSGADPSVRPYKAKVHGFGFSTDLPVLMIKLINEETKPYIYNLFQMVEIQNIDLVVEVDALKTLAVSNDFGPVDTSKPFQPFGANPVSGSSLVIGSTEMFQKVITSATINACWQTTPVAYKKDSTITDPKIETDYLNSGVWKPSKDYDKVDGDSILLDPFKLSLEFVPLNTPIIVKPDLATDESFNTSSRHGFVRLRLDKDFGQKDYLAALLVYLATKPLPPNGPPVGPPVGPFMNKLTIYYKAKQTIDISSADIKQFASREAQFLHLSPFGFAEQHSAISKDKKVFLLPQFDFQSDGFENESEAEFFIGISGLKPPQNLSLLIQVADGTANPLVNKPPKHIHWNYLRNNEWIQFKQNEVEDQTEGLLKSGIVTFSIPHDASDTNTLFPVEQHWIRAAASAKSDAVCRLIKVAAQGVLATFADKGNDPAFASKVLPVETISKLNTPVSEVKKITQPFESFRGRGAEMPAAFYARISERLRHKDRAIALWDYERMVLEAFPEIYRVKCLNHTQYEPNDIGTGIYRELAPGHVTIVTIPNKQFHNMRDPLKPFTSLGLLEDIAVFICKRVNCFVKLHVKNPQFDEVRVKMKVRFYDGLDEKFHYDLLLESIIRFLSPWAFTDGGSPTFGGKLYKSVLIDFVEELQYVDYVTDVELFIDVKDKRGTEPQNEIEGSKAISILTSVPADKHEIEVIHLSEKKIASDKCSCES